MKTPSSSIAKNIIVDTMPDHKGKAVLNIYNDSEGLHVFYGEREIWIEVSDEDNLIARAYFDQTSEDFTTLTITENQIEVNEGA